MEAICKEIRELASKRNELVCENKTLEYDIEIAKEELLVLCDDLSTMKEELPYLKKELANQQRKAMEEDLTEKNNEIKQLQSEIRQLSRKNNSLQVCSSTLQDEINHCKGHVKALENCMFNLNNKYCDTKSCVKKMQHEKQERDNNIEDMKRNLKELKNCLDTLSADLQEKCFEVDFILQNLKSNECSIGPMASKEKDLQKKIIELQEKFYKFQSKIRQESSTNQKLLENVCSARENLDDIQKQMQCYEREMDNMRQNRLCFLREIRDEIGKLKKARSESRETNKLKQGQELEMNKLKQACEESLRRFDFSKVDKGSEPSQTKKLICTLNPSISQKEPSSFNLTLRFQDPPTESRCSQAGTYPKRDKKRRSSKHIHDYSSC